MSIAARPRRAAPPKHGLALGLLPQPPDDVEKYCYVRRNLWVLTAFSLVSFSCLAVSQFLLARSTPLLWVFLPLLAITICYYLISLWVNAFTGDFSLRRHRRLTLSWRPATYPSVDVFLPVCGEPIDVLHNTWSHVQRLARRYPARSRRTCWTTPTTERSRRWPATSSSSTAAGRTGAGSRRPETFITGSASAAGEYILVLDADFAPRSDLLDELLPYLETDARTGIVQSPQFFRVLDQQNWIERGAGAVQELFYRAVQTSRQHNDGAICVGSCALYRREALAENGGTTLIEHSEDVHTGFDLRRLGWGLRYVPLALSAGLCPDDGRGLPQPAVPMVCRVDEPARQPEVLDGRLRLRQPAVVTCPASSTTCTPPCSRSSAPLIPIMLSWRCRSYLELQQRAAGAAQPHLHTIVFPAGGTAARYRLEAWACG